MFFSICSSTRCTRAGACRKSRILRQADSYFMLGMVRGPPCRNFITFSNMAL